MQHLIIHNRKLFLDASKICIINNCVKLKLQQKLVVKNDVEYLCSLPHCSCKTTVKFKCNLELFEKRKYVNKKLATELIRCIIL